MSTRPLWSLCSALLVQLFLWPHMTFWVGLVVAWKEHVFEIVAACFGLAGAYLLDRAKSGVEDAESTFSVAVAGREYATLLKGVFGVACAVVAACGVERPHVRWAAVRALGGFYFYAVPLPLVGRRIKEIFPGSKALFVATLQTWWPFAMCDAWDAAIATRADLVGCLFASFVMATCFMDIKDIEGDRAAGVVTIANLLGARTCLQACALGFAALSAYVSLSGGPRELQMTYALTSANMAHCVVHGERVPASWSVWSMMAGPRLFQWIC